MTAVLRWTGLGKLVSFYRYHYFNLPRVITALGVVLLLGIAAVRLYWLAGGFPVPNFSVPLGGYFGVLVIAALLAVVGMVLRGGSALVTTGWVLGSLVSAASITTYVAGRSMGLFGQSQLKGWWDYPLGTASMALAALFLALHFSVVTGMNVAYPQRRRWHD